MGQHRLPRQPVAVPVVVNDDEVTFKSCCTEMFRWIRKGIDLAEEILATFLATEFEGGRHARRIAEIDDLEAQF